MKKASQDYESEPVGFPGISILSSETAEIGTSTDKIILLDKDIQVGSTKNAEVQTKEIPVLTTAEVDETALLDFMRRFAPRVEEELRKRSKYFGSRYVQELSEGEEEDVPTQKLVSLKKHKNTEKGNVKHISWSCYGNKIALGISQLKHKDWCKHTSFLLIYNSDKNEEFTNEAQECIEVNTCIVNLKFHPSMNSVIVFATDEGNIYRHTSDKNQISSPVLIAHCYEKITQIQWVTLNSQTCLAVSSSEGTLGLWAPSSLEESWKLLKKFNFKSIEHNNERAVNCFEFSTLNSQNFIVALEGKLLLRCSTVVTSSSLIDKEFINPVISEYECSSVLVTRIRFSLFDENLFVTSSIDQKIKIYNLNEKSPINVISNDFIPLTLEWNHLKEEIFLTCDLNGEIRWYDHRRNRLVKSVKPLDESISIAFKVKGMKQMFAIADSNGEVSIWQTSLFASHS